MEAVEIAITGLFIWRWKVTAYFCGSGDGTPPIPKQIPISRHIFKVQTNANSNHCPQMTMSRLVVKRQVYVIPLVSSSELS